LQRLADSRLHLDEPDYQQAFRDGSIGLPPASRTAGSRLALHCRATGCHSPPTASRQPAAKQLAPGPAGHAGLQSWQQVITQQISQCCAAWFDHDQAEWQPDRHGQLYQNWLAEMALQPLPARTRRCATPAQAIATLPQDHHSLLPPRPGTLQAWPDWLADWFYVLLQRNSGWAAWCRYQQWQAELSGGNCSLPQQLLAMQLAWEWLLDDGKRDADSHWQHWHAAWDAHIPPAGHRARPDLATCRTGQPRRLLSNWPRPAGQTAPADIHAVFCRRALGTDAPGTGTSAAGIRTAGFAGFFGLPLAIRFAGEDHSQPRLPGLLAPSWEAIMPPLEKGLQEWGSFQRAPLSSFTLVESAGLGKAGKLLRKAFPGKRRARWPSWTPG
jgi:hypothetical protein